MIEKFEEEFIEDLESSDDVLYTDEEHGNEVIDLDEEEMEDTTGGKSTTHKVLYTAYIRYGHWKTVIKTGSEIERPKCVTKTTLGCGLTLWQYPNGNLEIRRPNLAFRGKYTFYANMGGNTVAVFRITCS